MKTRLLQFCCCCSSSSLFGEGIEDEEENEDEEEDSDSRILHAGRGFLTLMAILLVSVCSLAAADDFTSLCADRAAVERVYYAHRLGEKPPFEQTLPSAEIERLVRDELHKQSVLKKVYAVELTPALVEAEVQRINTTTRAPETLAEIKTALGNDPVRFARTVARPIVVERLLRQRFDNDDALHASQRRELEHIRTELLAVLAVAPKRLAWLNQNHSNAVTETIWQLGARVAETNTPPVDEIEIKKRFGPNAQLLSTPSDAEQERRFYFDDLPRELQNVLRVQLRQAGDVSAVIETPTGFLLYVAKEKTESVLSVAGLSLPKRSYEQWLEAQTK